MVEDVSKSIRQLINVVFGILECNPRNLSLSLNLQQKNKLSHIHLIKSSAKNKSRHDDEQVLFASSVIGLFDSHQRKRSIHASVGSSKKSKHTKYPFRRHHPSQTIRSVVCLES